MASKNKKSGKRPNLKTWAWLIAAGGFLLGSILFLTLLLTSGDERRIAALESGQRIEFSPKSGDVQGKLIRLADLADQIDGQEPTPTITDTPLPDIDEEAAALDPVEDFGEEVAEQQVRQPDIAPDTGLDPVQFRTKTGIIPGIAKDGTMPWQYYSQAGKTPPSGPKVAIVLYGLGLGSLATEAALALPAGVTLSFSPYSRNIDQWVTRTRSSGHEILLDLPMETERYPAMDPGPLGILNDLSAEESYQNLLAVLEKARGYVGLLMPLRETISSNANAITPLVDAAGKHGLLLLSSARDTSRAFSEASKRTTAPVLHADIVLDTRITEEHINSKLAEMEAIAKKQGFVIAVGRSFPVTVELVGSWARSLEAKGMTLVPITTLAKTP